jgi:hypothetical protein
VDFETTPTATLEVQATDANGLSDTETVEITINNVEEVPEIPAGQVLEVAEDAAAGDVVGTVEGSDSDGDLTTWSFVNSGANPNPDGDGDGQRLFSISNTGQITINDADELDFETNPSYTVEVQAFDSENNSTTESVTINVTDVNEAPEITEGQTLFIAENATTGEFLTGSNPLDATDPEGNIVDWSLGSSNPDNDGDGTAAFGIDNDGNVFVADEDDLDREQFAEQYTIDAIATDAEGLSDTQAITIQVDNVDEPPTIPSGQTFDVEENLPGPTVLGTVAVNDPEGDIASWSIATGNVDDDSDGTDLFAIDSNGVLSVADPDELDFETPPNTYSLGLTVTDSTGATATGTVTVNVLDVNEAPVIDPNQVLDVDENSDVGTEVGTVTATDAEGSITSWSITSPDLDGDGTPAFAIDNTGLITVNDADDLDFEDPSLPDPPAIGVTVTATDAEGLSATETVTIDINDINEAPDVTAGLEFSISEGAALDAPVGTVDATDPEGNISAWTISSGNIDTDGDGTDAFAIDATGQITVSDPDDVDFETNPSVVLGVTATDTGGLSDTEDVTININNVSEPPVIDPNQTLTVIEQAADGTAVGTVTASDPEGDIVNWDITGGNPDADDDGIPAFAIDNAGNIIVIDGNELDFETTPSYTLDVTVVDAGNNAVTEAVTIELEDLNEAPTIPPNQSFTVDEGTASGNGSVLGTVVGTVNFSDPEGDALTWSILGGNPNLDGDNVSGFGIDSETGELFVTDPADLDFETADSYVLDLEATDPAGNSVTQSVTVNLNDVNERPTVLAGQTFRVRENRPNGTVVGTVQATDPEDNVSGWAITSGNPNIDGDATSLFAIDATGQITVADSEDLDAELLESLFGGSVTLQVQASDGEFTNTKPVTIEIVDVNEAPVIVADQEFTAPEGAAVGTPIGTIAGNDSENNIVNWIIVSGNPDTDNDGTGALSLDSSGQLAIADPDDVDFETNPSFTLNVAVTDEGGLSSNADVLINVADTNEPPVIPPDQVFAVDENAANSAIVGTVNATDPDNNIDFWEITSGNPDNDGDGVPVFTINPDGVISVIDGDEINFESVSSYTLTVVATDDGGNGGTGDPLSASQTVVVNVNDINEPPNVPPGQSFDVDENAAVDTLVGVMAASDPEDNIETWSIDAASNPDNDGDGTAAFSIDAAGQILVADPEDLDFETFATNYTLNVTATDAGSLSTTAAVDITVNDINEGPVVTPGLSFGVVEAPADGTFIGAATATDPEGNGIAAWSIVDGNPDLDGDGVPAFSINNLGEITVTDGLDVDFETLPTYTLTLQATDSLGASNTGTVDVVITDANDFPSNIVLNAPETGLNQRTYTISGGFTDPDGTDTHTAVIDWGDGSTETLNFAVGETSFGELTHVYAVPGDYTITATVTDEINQTNSTSQIVEVGNTQFPDFNRDNLPGIVWRNFSTGENAIWFLGSDNSVIGGGSTGITVADPNWVIEGVGDYDADGQDDLLWRNYASGQNLIWLMDGNTPQDVLEIQISVPDPNWQIEGVGDFDGDLTRDDIIWRNSATGDNIIWFLDDATPTTSRFLTPVPDPDFHIGGVGDFDNDGLQDDLVWRNYRTGENLIWFISEDSVTSTAIDTSVPVSNWRIEGVSDFDGDGTANDLLWRNYATGETISWFLDGTNVVGGATITPFLDANSGWNVVI